MKEHKAISLFQHALPRDRLGEQMASLEAFHKHLLTTDRHKTTHIKEYAIIVVTDLSGSSHANADQRNQRQQPRRILLGMKHRGFGKGMYNSFAGKRTANESLTQCACRELEEEAGIAVPEAIMHECHLGAMHYTFADQAGFEMVAHVFHIDIDTGSSSSSSSSHCPATVTGSNTATNDPSDAIINHPDPTIVQTTATPLPPFSVDPNFIRGCEEITPQWFEDWFEHLPLDNMFADDSLWLTELLLAVSRGIRLRIDGWFHFLAGGQSVNSMRRYYMNIRPRRIYHDKNSSTGVVAEKASMATASAKSPSVSVHPAMSSEKISTLSLEKRLFHALKYNKIQNPSTKELDEGWAFCKAVQNIFGGKHRHTFDVVIDVAGGHGALGALLLLMTSATKAVVVDPADVGKGGVERAWRKDFLHNKTLSYQYEDLRTGLPAELKRTLEAGVPRERILVVACHACQHLSDEILEIVCCQFPGVHAAVMPCCQKDTSPGSSWKSSSKNLQVPVAKVMDLLLAGKVMASSWGKKQGDSSNNKYVYDVRMKLIDAKITPQNRIIFCRAIKQADICYDDNKDKNGTKIEKAHKKLATVYTKAHAEQTQVPEKLDNDIRGSSTSEASQLAVLSSQLSSLLSSNHMVGGLCLLVGFSSGFWIGRCKR